MHNLNSLKSCRVCDIADVKMCYTLKPYQDKDWEFNIWQCERCKSLMSERDSSYNYFEELYKYSTNYSRYSSLANIVQKTLSKNWIKVSRYILCSFYSYGTIIREIEKVSSSKKKLKILEIGSSTGFLTAYFNKIGHNCFGVDVSTKAVNESIEKFGNHYGLETPDDKFDVIFMCGIGGGISNISEVVSNNFKLLKDSGMMIFNVPNLNSKRPDYPWLSTPPPDVITLYNPEFKEFWFSNFKRKLTISSYEEIISNKINYKYPLKLVSNKSSVSLKYRGVFYFLIFNILKNAYLKILYFLGRYKKEELEYGLFITIKSN